MIKYGISKLWHFNLQNATLTPFKIPLPSISHFNLLGFSPDIEQNPTES